MALLTTPESPLANTNGNEAIVSLTVPGEANPMRTIEPATLLTLGAAMMGSGICPVPNQCVFTECQKKC